MLKWNIIFRLMANVETFRVGTFERAPLRTRTVIDVAQERWKDGGGHGTDVMFVPGDVGSQGHRD